nr:outer shell protein [Avian orthoreovirus]
MGNATSVVQNFNIAGDGNSFAPSAETTASAVPSLSLNPGLLNPGGKAWMLVDPTLPASVPGSLRLMRLSDISSLPQSRLANTSGFLPTNGMYLISSDETLTVLTEHAMSQFQKLEAAGEMDRDFLDAKGISPDSVNIMNYVVFIDCYVGVSARQAASNYQTNVPVITKSRIVQFMTSAQNVMQALSSWERDLREVMTFLPTTTTAGKLSCDMRSVVAFIDEQLPDTNLCRYYPDAAASSIAKRNGAIRWKDSSSGEVPSLACNDLVASTTGALGNTAPLIAKSSAGEESMRLINDADVDIICSRAPINSSVWARTVSPRTYNIRTLPVEQALWLRESQTSAGFDVTYKLPDGVQEKHFRIRQSTTVINLEQVGSMMFTVNLAGKDYKRGADFDPDGKTLVLLVIQSKIPFELLTVATQITGVAQVAEVVVHAADSSTENRKIIGDTSLTYLFERETTTTSDTEINTYLLCTWRFDDATTDATAWPDAWDAATTLTPLTSGTVTIKGTTVDNLVPADLVGSYSSESLAAALPNDAGLILADKASAIATAIKKEDDSVADESSPFSSPIHGVLAIQQLTTEGTRGVRTLKPPEFLKRLASRAMHMFLGDPQSILKQATPVLSDPNVWTGFLQGVRDGVRTKSLSTGLRSVFNHVSAAQSVQSWKQGFLSQVQTFFKPS